MFCQSEHGPMLGSLDWLVLADNMSHPQHPNSRRILFDAGGSRFATATKFFVTKYAERGLAFDEVYVWEVKKQDEESYWNGTAADVRQVWEPRLTFYNGVPVTADPNSANNPVTRIHEMCGPDDFCAFKLDIDTPEVELPLAQQLIQNPGHLKETWSFCVKSCFFHCHSDES